MDLFFLPQHDRVHGDVGLKSTYQASSGSSRVGKGKILPLHSERSLFDVAGYELIDRLTQSFSHIKLAKKSPP